MLLNWKRGIVNGRRIFGISICHYVIVRKDVIKMKKIKTLFERKFEGHKIVGITDKLTDFGFEWPIKGE